MVSDQIAERHRLGLDRFDEIWDGEYHMNAAPHPRHSYLLRFVERYVDPLAEAVGLVALGEFNIGTPLDYRIPDAGYVRALPHETFVPTAELVIEMLSPGDATFDKLPFDAAHAVREVLVVNPTTRAVRWLQLDAAGERYVDVHRSTVLQVSADDISAHLPWEHLEQ